MIREQLRLSQLEALLPQLERLEFHLPNGQKVPAHFHVTELGAIQRNFIDCGGTMRQERRVNFQLWTSIDYHHRLGVEKLEGIIRKSKRHLDIEDELLEVEYQTETIGRYGVGFHDGAFHLLPLQTDCLAKDSCGIPAKVKEVAEVVGKCIPGGGCC